MLALGVAAGGWAAYGGGPDVDLDGAWVLASGRTAEGPLAMTPYTRVSLVFDADGMGGKAACNDYGANFDLDGSSFDIPGPGIEQTLMGCGEGPDALDRQYFAALMAVDTVARNGDVLTMTGPDVVLELRVEDPWPRAEVAGTRWRLATWTDESGAKHRPTWQPGLRPFLRLGDSGGVGGRISASSGCRVLEGRWRVWRGAPTISRAQWRGRCRDRLMAQEMAVNSALSEPVVEVRRRAGRTELVVAYAHANSPARLVYRR